MSKLTEYQFLEKTYGMFQSVEDMAQDVLCKVKESEPLYLAALRFTESQEDLMVMASAFEDYFG